MPFRRPGIAIAAALAAGLAGAAAGAQADPLDAWRADRGVAAHADLVLAGPEERPLAAAPWAASFDVELRPGEAARVLLPGAEPLHFERPSDSSIAVRHGDRLLVLPERRPPLAASRHVELAHTSAAVDGVGLGLGQGGGAATSIRFEPVAGRPVVRGLLVTRSDRPDALLLHRLGSIHSRTPPNRFPLGSTEDDRLRFDTGWTSGFWAGALWQATDLVGGGSYFATRALGATLDHFGRERLAVHDLGFMYGHSSLAAYRRECRGTPTPICANLRRSALTAARTLLALGRSNGRAGAIPIRRGDRRPDTIIDSMMNLDLLLWAGRATRRPGYARLARRHARTVARHLVRGDGSTAQSVHLSPRTGRVLKIHTHQGLDHHTTWARGQAWGLYGFAQAGRGLRDRTALRVAERLARYVERHLPAGGVPRYDYDAPAGAPDDVSAGVIAAAGLYRLAGACRALPGACRHGRRWEPLAGRMLDAALTRVRTAPPLGLLGDQVRSVGGKARWDDDSELVFGLDYALEAVAARARRGG